uniref:Rhodopsin domain-containing protein n=1 Tax=Talaromyces marneffei PM1 TaxID=1077442 RepID=A0A093V2B8_TALMA
MDTQTGPTVASTAVATKCALWVVTAAATTTFILRIWSRLLLTRDLGYEDLVMAIGWNAENMVVDLPFALKLALISVSLGINALFLPKISVALLLTRLLRPSRWAKFTLISTSILAFILGVVGVILTFVQCNPIPGQWNPERYHPTCWDPSIQENYSYFVGAFSALLDLAYAIYPASVFWKLKLVNSRKIELSILMGLGTISGAVAIYKTSLLRLLANREAGIDTALYESSRLTLWTIIEANIIIIAACVPLTTPIFRWFRNKTVVTFTGARSTAVATNGGSSKNSKYATHESEHNFSRITKDKYPAYNPDGSQIYIRDDFEVQSYRDLELDGISPTHTGPSGP